MADHFAHFMTPYEMSTATSLAPIDTCFEVFPAVLHDFSRLQRDFPWSKASAELPTTNRLIETFILAVGLQWIGRVLVDAKMIQASYPAYQHALQMLRARISSVDVTQPKEAAIMMTANHIITAVEAMEAGGKMLENIGDGKDHQSWSSSNGLVNSEMHGINRAADLPNAGASFLASVDIMREAGPEAFVEEPALSIFRSTRTFPVPMSLYEKTECFLDSDEWRTVPYRYSELTWQDRLWHLVVKVPGILRVQIG